MNSKINSVNTQMGLNTCARMSFGSKSGAIKKMASSARKELCYGLKWIAQNFSSPQQRAIMGITALCSQPFIDLHNKHIKKEDKSIVVSKTIAKIIVGTCIGVCLRHYAIKAVRNFTKTTNMGKYSQCLLPKNVLAQLRVDPKSVLSTHLENYRNGLGTFIGTMGGLFTNFLIDAPLTKMLTNFINEKVFNKEKVNAK